MNPSDRILICDDDAAFHLAFKHALKAKRATAQRFEVRSTYNTDEAFALLRGSRFDVLVLDVQMRSADEGLKAIAKVRPIDPEMAIVMSSSLTDFKTVREAMKAGASDYVAKDFDSDELLHTLERVIEQRRLRRQNIQQNAELIATQKQHVLIGKSKPIEKLRRLIEKARPTQANVIITGETGAGKEVIARQFRQVRPDGTLEPFVAVDSSTIQSSLAESILFGHEKGAFTGADQARKGLFEEADGGIIYFDEIGNMPLGIQAKLLRVLQEGEVIRLGSTRALKLSFRAICATNCDLEELVEKKLFKGDLYQRLNVFPVEVPPLRERRDDIPHLIEHFAIKERQGGREPLHFARAAMEALKSYSWPGNVRELGNVVAYLTVMAESPEIGLNDLPPKIRENRGGLTGKEGQSFYSQVEDFEKRILLREYERLDRNISRIAKTLEMDRSHLYSKLRKYGIHP